MAVTTEAGSLARELLFTDAAWCLDVFNSARDTEGGAGFAPWMMLSINARVAVEGRKVIEFPDPNVGAPHLVEFLAEDESPSIAKARHAAKLLDNTKKSLEDFRAEMQRYWSAHHKWMRGNTPRILQGLVKELAVVTFEEHIVLATIPTQVRFDIPAGSPESVRDTAMKLGEDLGKDLSAFHLLVGSEHPHPSTLDLKDLSDVNWEDQYVRKFLPAQYEDAVDDEAKMLLLLLESDLNVLVFMLRHTAPGNDGAFFRNAMITVWHALVSLQTFVDAYPSVRAGNLRRLLGSADVTTFLDPANKPVRNVFMHYIPPNVPLDASKPMRGIVEALNPAQDLRSLSALTWHLAQEAQRALEDWRVTH